MCELSNNSRRSIPLEDGKLHVCIACEGVTQGLICVTGLAGPDVNALVTMSKGMQIDYNLKKIECLL